jgi:hypothetical protein
MLPHRAVASSPETREAVKVFRRRVVDLTLAMKKIGRRGEKASPRRSIEA